MIEESLPTHLSLADTEHFHFLLWDFSRSSFLKHFWPGFARAVHPHSCEGTEVCSSAAHLKCQTLEGSLAMHCNPEGGCFVTVPLQLRALPSPGATCTGSSCPGAAGLQLLTAQPHRDLGCRACSERAPALLLGCAPKTGLGTQRGANTNPRDTLCKAQL